jgi:hypothetical protein
MVEYLDMSSKEVLLGTIRFPYLPDSLLREFLASKDALASSASHPLSEALSDGLQ